MENLKREREIVREEGESEDEPKKMSNSLFFFPFHFEAVVPKKET